MVAAASWAPRPWPRTAAARRRRRPAGAADGLATAKSHMVAAANPHAVEAGLEMLRAGGSAADAAIAVQLVLNLVEPQSSGIGGGAFVLHWDAAAKQLKTYDGRETAPAAAKPDRFLVDGQPRKFDDAVFGGLSVGVPGTRAPARGRAQAARPAALGAAVRAGHPAGRARASASRRACTCCCAGTAPTASPPARGAISSTAPAAPARSATCSRTPSSRPPCAPSPSGGADAFYKGAIAEAIVAAVREAPNHQGDITARRPRRLPRQGARAGLRRLPRATASAAWARPRPAAWPSAQVLKLIEPFDLGTGPADAMNARGAAPHRRGREARLRRPRPLHRRSRFRAGAGRPARCGAISTRRRALIDPGRRHGPARAPARRRRSASRTLGDDETVEAAGTSHFSIVDGDGNVARHDHHHRGGVRLAAVGGGLPAQQRAHRLLLPPRRSRRPAARQRRRARQAAAQLDGARPSCSTSRASRGPRSARPAAAASSSTWSRRWWR